MYNFNHYVIIHIWSNMFLGWRPIDGVFIGSGGHLGGAG